MSKWNVTIKAVIVIEDPEILEQLVIARLYEDKVGIENLNGDDEDFKVIDYPSDWLDFEEVIE
jgi:hypothetical protein|tara:strand:- start:81 stop:269 length:189 start_codon:yes stop_codon:yes gene_type:complete